MNSRLENIFWRTILYLLMTGGRSFGREVFEAVPSEAGVVSSGSGSGGQRFMREPLDQIAAIGEHVTLPCRVSNKLGALQWTRDDFGLGTDRNLSGYKRYQMTGSDEEGDFTLDINPVELEDDARFQCQVGASEGIEPIRSRYATLTVLAPPSPPRLLPEGDIYRTVEGRQVELRCESKGGKPAAEITWFDERNMVITEGVRTLHELMEDGKRFISISVLRFRATVAHNGKNLTCQAQNSATPQPQLISTRLEVHFAPHVSLTSDRGELLQEGDPVRFVCSATANPAQVTYAWYIGGKRVATRQDGADTELMLEHVDRRLHNQAIRCEVTNPIGRTEKSAVLNIAYAPRFVTKPANVAANLGDHISLACHVDANPKPVYTWNKILFDSKGGEEKVEVGNAQNLTFTLNEESAGRYECTASVPGNADIWARASVFLRGPPKIFSDGKDQTAPLDSTGKVTCEALSVPPVERVEWFYRDQPVFSGVYAEGLHYSVIENRTQDGVVSTLIIAKVSSQDFGEYTCRVSNSLGSDVALIKLTREPSLPLAIVLVGIIGGLILTAALILMVVLCRRHFSRYCSCCGSNGFKMGGSNGNGSDITAFTNNKSGSKRDRKSGSDSDNSGDYKIDVRTTSSMSNQDSDSNWDELEERPATTTTATLPSTGHNNNNNNNNNTATRTLPSGRYPPQVMTNGGLVYHQHYANNSLSHLHSSLQRPSSDYVDSARLLTATNGLGNTQAANNYQTSGNYDDFYSRSLHQTSQQQIYKNNFGFTPSPLGDVNAGAPGPLVRDNGTRYSMHISGNSPVHISPTLHGITVKTSNPQYGYGYGGGVSSSKNVSFDYVPGGLSAAGPHQSVLTSSGLHHPDNYAVYVNSTAETNYSPATTTSLDSGSTVKVGSLATHV